MRLLYIPVWLAFVLALLIEPVQHAEAQWNNRPYGSFIGGAGVSVGMSPGYRQVIIADRLAGEFSRNNLLRDRAGFLVDVERSDGQAFVLLPSGYPAAGNGAGVAIGGFGYGMAATGGYRRTGASARYDATLAFNGWWPLVAEGDRSGRAASLASTPMDGWIAQLDNL